MDSHPTFTGPPFPCIIAGIKVGGPGFLEVVCWVCPGWWEFGAGLRPPVIVFPSILVYLSAPASRLLTLWAVGFVTIRAGLCYIYLSDGEYLYAFLSETYCDVNTTGTVGRHSEAKFLFCH